MQELNNGAVSPLKDLQDAMIHALEGGRLSCALNFAADLNANNIFFAGSGRDWHIGGTYGNSPAYMMLDDKGKNIGVWLNLEVDFDDNLFDDELRDFILNHVVVCPQSMCVSPYCDNSKNKYSLLGKEFESTCHSPIAFLNPDTATYENMKKLFLLFKLFK